MSGTQRSSSWADVWSFVACLVVLSLSGAGLVLTIPHLLAGATPSLWGAAAMLAIMVIGFGLLGYRLRPALSAQKE